MSEIFLVEIDGGHVLKGRKWITPNAKANLSFITGMQEHAQRYDRFGKYLNEHGVNLFVLDHFGQGLNAPLPVDLQRWPKDAFALTLQAMEKERQLAADNGLPTVVGGHSMGSFMTQAYLEAYPHPDQKAIIMGSNGGQGGLMSMGYAVACMMVHKSNWNEPNKFMTNLGMGGYAKSIKDRKSDIDWLSYNEENVAKYAADPYCGVMNTGGFWKEFLRGMKEIWKKKNMRRINHSSHLLLVSGEDDPVGQCGKGVRWLEKAYLELGVSDTKAILYPKMRHEILNEDKHDIVDKDILDFIMR